MSIHGGGSDRFHRSNSEGNAEWVDRDLTTTSVRSRPTMTRRLHSVPNYTDTEMENALNAFFHEEATSLKTTTRLLVENFLSKFNWYFPSRKLRTPPSLSKAYAYYEHVILPRKVVGGDTPKHLMKRADPGEHDVQTELYSFFTTRASAFKEWGLGIDQYFITVRIFAFLLLLVGLLNLPNLMFYRSREYSPSPNPMEPVGFFLQGSAVCTTSEWIVCSNCADHRWSRQGLKPKLAFWIDDTTGRNTTLVQRYNCNGGQFRQGIFSFVCFLFSALAMVVIDLYLDAREVRIDEDKITSSDYTVAVNNPPKDAFNPDEWRDFFSQFTSNQVTAVTIAVNNRQLLTKLIQRRRHLNNLRVILPKGTDMDDENALQIAVAELVREREQEKVDCFMYILQITLILPIMRVALGWFLSPTTLLAKSLHLTQQIKELQAEKYDVVKVFVTFEDEEGQRAALAALSFTRLDIINNKTHQVSPGTVFHDRVLSVSETAEPNAIRWLNLEATPIEMNVMRLVNLGITAGIVTVAGIIVARVRHDIGANFAGPLITILNTIVPIGLKILMNFEPHHTEGSFQSSLYMKITLFRWVNTAILIKMITSWTSTLGNSPSNLLPAVNSVLWSELCLTPIVRILDVWGAFQKHVLGPRARTQEQMNMWFQGTPYNLGERYTDLTKIMFLCFFYAALYPAAFFFGSAILIVQYYADKFCLLRVWANNAAVGSEVARMSRKYFFTGALLAYCIVSAYVYAGFPYDNLCLNGNSTAYGAAGTYENAIDWDNVSVGPLTVTRDEVFVFCKQNWRGFDGFIFPPTARIQKEDAKWMTPTQERSSNLFGWGSVVAVVVYFFLFLFRGTSNFILSWFRGVYTPKGQVQHIDFSSDNDILGYVPQIKLPGFLFPFLACDVDHIDKSLIGWSDRGKPYDHHNLIFDVPWQGMPREKESVHNLGGVGNDAVKVTKPRGLGETSVERRPIFSTIKHYPPAWALKLKEQEGDGIETRLSTFDY